MEVIVDGVRESEFGGEETDLVSVLAEVSEALRQRGRAVLAVVADGRDVSPEEVAEVFADKTTDDIKSLEFKTEEAGLLVETSLNEMSEVIGELANVCHGLAEVFQGESPDEGYDTFNQLAGIWQEVKTRQQQVVNTMGLDFEALVLEGVTLAAIHSELNKYLNEAVEALEARDCVLLGDLLEYELAPRAENEAKIVTLLQARLKADAG